MEDKPPKERKFKRGLGRPTKLTQEMADRIINFIRLGSYADTAAAAVGITKDTYHSWLRQGARLRDQIKAAEAEGVKLKLSTHERRLAYFSDSLEKAQAEADMMDLSTIRKASTQNWQAAAWRLERKNPDKWGRRDYLRQEVSGPGGEPVKTEVTTVPGGPERIAHAYKEKLRREVLEEMRQKGEAA